MELRVGVCEAEGADWCELEVEFVGQLRLGECAGEFHSHSRVLFYLPGLSTWINKIKCINNHQLHILNSFKSSSVAFKFPLDNLFRVKYRSRGL